MGRTAGGREAAPHQGSPRAPCRTGSALRPSRSRPAGALRYPTAPSYRARFPASAARSLPGGRASPAPRGARPAAARGPCRGRRPRGAAVGAPCPRVSERPGAGRFWGASAQSAAALRGPGPFRALPGERPGRETSPELRGESCSRLFRCRLGRASGGHGGKVKAAAAASGWEAAA